MPWLAYLLYPFSILYDLVTSFRNRMFDWGWKSSVDFEVPVIVVGNLNVGGSGKTPMVEFLIKKFSHQYTITVLSRGYGRKTKGFLWVDQNKTADEVGDEPNQMFSKFRYQVSFAVGEKRVEAIERILKDRPETNLLILDDAYQHRYVKGDCKILLTNFNKPFYKDYLLPMGRLREARKGARRADAIVVTKCPADLTDGQKSEIVYQISQYSEAKVVFARIEYAEALSVFKKNEVLRKCALALSGIADDRLFLEECAKRFDLVDKITFPDHHVYKTEDIQAISKKCRELGNDHMIITTEKDAVKLKNEAFQKYLEEIPIFALPMEFQFDSFGENILQEIILNRIRPKAQRL